MNRELKELLKEVMVDIHGTEMCKKTAQYPSNDLYFSFLRENLERQYMKYKADLSEEQYVTFIDDIFAVYKEYKLKLDSADESMYKKILGDTAEKIQEVVNTKYGLKIRPV